MTQPSLPLVAEKRPSYTDKLVALFLIKPGEFIDGLALAKIAGAYAWRTRTAEARKRLEVAGLGTIENVQIRTKDGPTRSLYRYLPRDAA